MRRSQVRAQQLDQLEIRELYTKRGRNIIFQTSFLCKISSFFRISSKSWENQITYFSTTFVLCIYFVYSE